MRVTFLGTGTSVGVPVPGCECPVCVSADPRNKRLRTSVLLEGARSGVDGRRTTILIDTPPDIRQQFLRVGYRDLDAVFYTHAHADHIMGIDDLRPFNFRMQRALDLYADDATATQLEQMFRYAFFEDPEYQGGAPPQLVMRRISPATEVVIGDLRVIGVPIFHGRKSILGFRVGKFAYLTDCSAIPESSQAMLRDLEVLVVSGLRHRLHPTHFTVSQALEMIEILAPQRALLTHISHELDHEETERFIAQRTPRDVAIAYDGLVLDGVEEE